MIISYHKITFLAIEVQKILVVIVAIYVKKALKISPVFLYSSSEDTVY